jgi:hypothetical protein
MIGVRRHSGYSLEITRAKNIKNPRRPVAGLPALPLPSAFLRLRTRPRRARRRKFCRAGRRVAERSVVAGRGSRAAPKRQPFGRVPQSRRRRQGGFDDTLRGVLRPLRNDTNPQQCRRVARERIDRKRAWPSQKSARRCSVAAYLARLRRSCGMAGLCRRDRWPRQRAQCQAHRSGADGAEETAGSQDRRL